MAAPTYPINLAAMRVRDRSDAVDLHWLPNPEDDRVTEYRVWRSQTPTGIKIRVNQAALSRPDYRDEASEYSGEFHYYYFISALNADGETFSPGVPAGSQFISDGQFGPFDDWGRIKNLDRAAHINGFPQEQTPDRERLGASFHNGMKVVFREILRRSRWVLDVLEDPAELWFRKWAGPMCGSCYTPGIGPRDRCLECYGTGISGGYDLMPDTKVRVVPTPNKIMYTDAGMVQDRRPQAWLDNWPTVHQGDIVCTADGKRFAADSITRFATRGYYSRQHFILAEVPETSVIYMLGRGAG